MTAAGRSAVLFATAMAASLVATHAGAQINAFAPDSQQQIVDPKGPAAPAAQIRLTVQQKEAIAAAVQKENKPVSPPPSFVVQVGAPVPPAIELYVLPDPALQSIPTAKMVKYTKFDNQLILVDPTTMRVVDVIRVAPG